MSRPVLNVDTAMRESLDLLPVLVWTAGTDKLCAHFNRAWLEFTGRTLEQEIGFGWAEGVHPDDRERCMAIYSRAFDAREPFAMDYRLRRFDGEYRWIRDAGAPRHDPSGTFLGYLGTCVDIHTSTVDRDSARAAAERLERLLQDLRESEERLRQAQKMEAMGQLAGGIAHDFNNTLTVIGGNVDLVLQDPSLPPELAGPLRYVAAAADRAATLTQQLLVFSRRRPPRTRTLDLNETVAGASRLLGRILPATIVLEARLGEGPLSIRGDPALLEQIVLNLAINARDAMPNGGRLLLRTSRADGAVLLTVTDEGVGVPPENLPRIFEPFFTTKATGQGTGLGLATVHGVVGQHGGSIEVDSEVGRGTTFRVKLPACDDPVEERAATSSPRREIAGRRILIVEDNPGVRSLARRALEAAGYRVREASDAAEALGVWREIGGEVALVLTDVVMPGSLSGLDLAARLREERPDLPVIFTSGYSDDIIAARAPVREGEDYLPKPYQAVALVDIIARALARRAGA